MSNSPDIFIGIRNLPETKIIGMKMQMTFAGNRTSELWRRFMPRRKEIRNAVSDDLFSIQIYSGDFDFSRFDVNMPFEKWAGREVPDFSFVPAGMEALVLDEGSYAVFIHRGAASEGEKTFRHIFGEWLPGSGYKIDLRPHFEILGKKYKNEDPDSEEEIWIPLYEE
ncbi:MAG TPA: GyrI-like domain-containing protein [Bacteroidales bacterium]|jgi:AraC family transcriptional regulator|nr:GyrI-like domain-containing protein [Bacteroidales bacterium]